MRRWINNSLLYGNVRLILLLLLFRIEKRDGDAEWIQSEKRSEVLSVFRHRKPPDHYVMILGVDAEKKGREYNTSH